MNDLPKFLTLLFITCMTLPASADAPSKQPNSRYMALWKDSLFTTKPPPPDEVEDKTFDDWTLVGVAKTPTGPRVTLLNKKDRTKRITISNGKSVQGFEVVSVNMSRNYKESTVKIRAGGKVGEIRVDEKMSSLKNAPKKGGAKPKRTGTNGNKRKSGVNRNVKPPVPNLNSRNNNAKKKTKKRPRIVRPRK